MSLMGYHRPMHQAPLHVEVSAPGPEEDARGVVCRRLSRWTRTPEPPGTRRQVGVRKGAAWRALQALGVGLIFCATFACNETVSPRPDASVVRDLMPATERPVSGGLCGDGVRGGVEQCDGEALDGRTCTSEGFLGGTLRCKANCTLETSGCFRCGDGVRSGSEPCDGPSLGGKSCTSLGFEAGTLACNADCTLDTSGCSARTPDLGVTTCTKRAGNGAPYATIQAAVDAAVPGDIICVVAGSYVLTSPIAIKTQGSASEPVELRAEGSVTLTDRGKALGLWSGMFELDGAAYITLRGFHLVDISWFGVRVTNSDHITVDGLKTERSPSSGVYVDNSSYVNVTNNDVGFCCLGDSSSKNPDGSVVGSQECITISRTSHFEVGHNEVHDSPRAETGGEGIDVKVGVRFGRIHHNRVHDLVRVGIYVDPYDIDSDTIEIDSNEVFRCYVGIILASEEGGAATNIAVHDNVLHHNGGDWAPASSFYPWREYAGITIAKYGGNGPRRDIAIYNNTIVDNSYQGQGVGIRVETGNASKIAIRNNLIAGHADGIVAATAGSLSEATNNLVYPYAASANEIEGSAALHLDPLFVKPSANDYHLQSKSPAIDWGLPGSPIATFDADGKPRQVGPAVDLGAYEYRPPSP